MKRIVVNLFYIIIILNLQKKCKRFLLFLKLYLKILVIYEFEIVR